MHTYIHIRIYTYTFSENWKSNTFPPWRSAFLELAVIPSFIDLANVSCQGLNLALGSAECEEYRAPAFRSLVGKVKCK